ncbi:DUF803 domain-containing protein, partial [Toxoplasma gondii TgCatPRC2]
SSRAPGRIGWDAKPQPTVEFRVPPVTRVAGGVHGSLASPDASPTATRYSALPQHAQTSGKASHGL